MKLKKKKEIILKFKDLKNLEIVESKPFVYDNPTDADRIFIELNKLRVEKKKNIKNSFIDIKWLISYDGKNFTSFDEGFDLYYFYLGEYMNKLADFDGKILYSIDTFRFRYILNFFLLFRVKKFKIAIKNNTGMNISGKLIFRTYKY